MIGDVILRKDDAWVKFTGPRCVIVTEKLDEVRKSLEEVESLVNKNGWTAAGFVSYEAAPAFDPALKVISSKDRFPLLWFGLYDSFETLESLESSIPLPPLEWTPGTEREAYNHAIQIIKDRISQGKTYQVNYTMRLSTNLGADVTIWQLFSHLTRSQNKYAAYLDIDNWSICSASHELFFDLDQDVITSRPMKGTIKRGRTTIEDKNAQGWLHASTKNRAENVMIVDMIRNDIGRIAEVSSVRVPELFTIEKYPTLFQMTSTVQAKTKASVTEIFANLFPCASITGAPKVSTMNIIAELETSSRKVYCGSIGYITPGRKARFNVAIRTACIDKQKRKAEYGIGGGIVWDSTSADEYSEALLKAQVLTSPPQKDFSLFETLLWTPEEGYFLLDRHVARMMDSANYFGFKTENLEANFRKFLADTSLNITSPKRIKVQMNSKGDISGEVKDFQSTDKVFQVCLAKNPINSNDCFLFHKTTSRDVYNSAAIAGFDDVLLYNEKDELTEFTIGNLVVQINGEFFTPPIECGLLTGTFRAELVASGKVKERILKIQDWAEYEAMFLVNSVRKWVKISVK
ncbi:MAG: aminodeoxychorismate synthase component I [Anaerolineales bacterium]